MSWYTIPEIAFRDFVACLKPLYEVLEKRNRSKSSPDVFLKTILAAHGGMTLAQWEAAEAQRLHEKVMSMKMGDFHEELMGKIRGYKTLPVGHPTGTDVSTDDETHYLELKNRDNTMNSDSAKSVVSKLTKLVQEGKRATLVLINTSKKTLPRFKAPAAVNVIDGRQAYADVTGRESFYDDLVATLDETFRRYPTYAELQAAAPPA